MNVIPILGIAAIGAYLWYTYAASWNGEKTYLTAAGAGLALFGAASIGRL